MIRKTLFAAAFIVGPITACAPMAAALGDNFEVAGVEEGDMLKLRAGPGTGFQILAGLPNGTPLRVQSCQQTGSTRWCKVTSQQSRGLSGYVSWAYLSEI